MTNLYEVIPPNILQKFEMVTESGCWIWTGYTHSSGYGRMPWNGRQQNAHRAIYEMFHGPVDKDKEVDHLCRVRCCVNPNHMEPVPHRINSLRGMGVAAFNAVKTSCVNGHPFSDENTYVSKYKYRRNCKECHKVQERIRRWKMKMQKIQQRPHD